jgi:signal transduction histidine kinase
MHRMPLSDVVHDAVATAAPVAAGKGITLVEQTAVTPTPIVDVDPLAMSRVVGNLLGNAIRHTPNDGTVDIAISNDDKSVYLSISDECGGIAADDIDRVFEVAFRGTPARTPVPDGGAGLGLAIARGIVNAHNGRIGAENVGPGCRFTIALPRSHPDHEIPRPNVAADQPNGRIRGSAESLA